MAYDIFLKIDGIDGESMDDKHKNEIEVLSWRWNIHQESTMHAGSGLGSGKVSVTNLDFDHYIDRASPNLFKYCASGKHIPQAILVMRKAGGNPLEYRMTQRSHKPMCAWCQPKGRWWKRSFTLASGPGH